MWSFETDPEFQRELDWISAFIREHVEPLDHILPSQWNIEHEGFQRRVRPLQAQVKARLDAGLHLVHDHSRNSVGHVRPGLTLPPELAYGDRAVGGGIIPANSELCFECELLEVGPAGQGGLTRAREKVRRQSVKML